MQGCTLRAVYIHGSDWSTRGWIYESKMKWIQNVLTFLESTFYLDIKYLIPIMSDTVSFCTMQFTINCQKMVND